MSRRALLVLLALATPAGANVGKATVEGTRTAEPAGLRAIAISREELRFDLRALADGGGAEIAATYVLENRGAEVTAPLVFVGGTPLRTLVITFDGVAITGSGLTREQVHALPAAWRAPVTTPAFDGDGVLGYETAAAAAVAFTLAIPPGEHQLAVRYQATPQRNRSKAGGTLVHQLGYVLAPARDWGAFGALVVSVDVPPSWRVATSPKLARTGDTLRGTFHGLPADTLGITLQAPTGMLHDVLQYALPLLVMFVLGGGGFAMYALGRRRRTADLRPLWPVSLPASFGWALAIGTAGGFTAMRGELALPAGQVAAYGYGPALGVLLSVFVALIAIPVGVLIARAGSKLR